MLMRVYFTNFSSNSALNRIYYLLSIFGVVVKNLNMFKIYTYTYVCIIRNIICVLYVYIRSNWIQKCIIVFLSRKNGNTNYEISLKKK